MEWGMGSGVMRKVSIRTRERCELVDITSLVVGVVEESGVGSGLAVVFVPHTTAGVTMNENADPDVRRDLLRKLGEVIPKGESYYRHSEGNSDAHLKATLVGQSVTVMVEGGRLELGVWQAIYFAEFDGPRERELLVKVIGG